MRPPRSQCRALGVLGAERTCAVAAYAEGSRSRSSSSSTRREECEARVLILKNKNRGSCWCRCCLVLLRKLMLTLAATSCRFKPPFAAASCASAGCGRIAAAALRSTLLPSPLLGCRWYAAFCSCFRFYPFMFGVVAGHPHSPSQFWRRPLQVFAYFQPKHPKSLWEGHLRF